MNVDAELKNLEVYVDWPLDEDTLTAVKTYRKLRLQVLKQIKQGDAKKTLIARGLLKGRTDQIEGQEINAYIDHQLATLERYDDADGVHLDELLHYYETMSKKTPGSQS